VWWNLFLVFRHLKIAIRCLRKKHPDWKKGCLQHFKKLCSIKNVFFLNVFFYSLFGDYSLHLKIHKIFENLKWQPPMHLNYDYFYMNTKTNIIIVLNLNYQCYINHAERSVIAVFSVQKFNVIKKIQSLKLLQGVPENIFISSKMYFIGMFAICLTKKSIYFGTPWKYEVTKFAF